MVLILTAAVHHVKFQLAGHLFNPISFKGRAGERKRGKGSFEKNKGNNNKPLGG
jgi:hypothetical protein